MRAKLGPPKAITAAAHKLARIIFHLVTTGQISTIRALPQINSGSPNARRINDGPRTALGFQLLPVKNAG
jgi:hypothetical protein